MRKNIVLLPPLFAPPVAYFKAIAGADLAVIDTAMRYDKRQKSVHRTVVTGAHAAAFLTVPVTTPGTSRCPWDEVRVSPHGQWWRVMTSTLATLFGPTPYYNYYRQDFAPMLTEQAVGRPITDLDLDIILAVCRLVGIRTPLSVTLDPRYKADNGVEIADLRYHDFYADPAARSILETLFTQGNDLQL